MRIRDILLAGACLGALGLSMAAPARADVTDDLLNQLQAKGILTAQEVQVLKARKAEEDAKRGQAVPDTTRAQAQAPAGNADSAGFIRAADTGVGLRIGEVEVKLSGSINGFYTYDNPKGGNDVVVGGVAGGTEETSSIRSGLLPSFLKFDITTTQGGIDVGAHFGLYPGINSSATAVGANSGGLPIGLGTSGIDFRQNYLTFGTKNAGEIKIGRDIGLFGSDVILNDITLLGVGTAAGNNAPGNTSLGRIGIGYIYTDFQPQITYTSPDFGGFKVAAGIFQPLHAVAAPGFSLESDSGDTPGFQAKATYTLDVGGVKGTVWGSFLTQELANVGGTGRSPTGQAFDVGTKLTFGPVTALGYYYTTEGVGTTGLFYNAIAANGNKRDSDGFILQGQAKFGKAALGVSYGESNLDLAGGEAVSELVETNQSWVFQAQYALTSWLNLVGEYTNTESDAHNGNKAENNSIALGAIMFF
ncbi:porin [Aerophototrophica crusticola]|uniref:Porin n=1 Tax=Aerophototrophica crusticola TaxID=1709002 RepID=A0A858R4A2_9PROT|nr:porin [Rhodospirillaceae bacterium B3]